MVCRSLQLDTLGLTAFTYSYKCPFLRSRLRKITPGMSLSEGVVAQTPGSRATLLTKPDVRKTFPYPLLGLTKSGLGGNHSRLLFDPSGVCVRLGPGMDRPI